MTVRRTPLAIVNYPRLAPLRPLLTLPLVALCIASLVLGALFAHLGGEVRESETIATDQTLLRAVDRATASWPVAVAENSGPNSLLAGSRSASRSGSCGVAAGSTRSSSPRRSAARRPSPSP